MIRLKASQVRAMKRKAFRTVVLLTALILLSVSLAGCYPNREEMARVRRVNAEEATRKEMERLAKERRKPSSADLLTDLTQDIQRDLEEIAESADNDATNAKDIVATKAALKRAKTRLAKLDDTIQAGFKRTEAKIAKIGSKKIAKRQDKFEDTYEKKLAKLSEGLNEVIAAKGESAEAKAKALSKYIASLIPEEKHQPLGSSLPHRNVDYQAGEPILGTNIAPAYMGQTQGLEPSSLPRTPTDDDLAETVDTKQTDAIKALADKLDKDPVKIYEYVRNNIVYEPYYGSRKGAQETLWEKGGNDIDQANLLIALYRYSGVPTRYVTGVVEIPIDRAMNWVGVEKPEVAAKVFSSAGIPSKAIVRGGRIDAVQIEHTWAEVYVSYSRYRGVDEGTGGPKMWLPLDASMKRYEYKEPMDVLGGVGFNAEEFSNEVVSAATLSSDQNALVSFDSTSIKQRFDQITDQVLSSVDTSASGPSIEDLIGSKTIIKEKLGLLPASLPVGIKPISISAENASFPKSHRYEVTFSIGGSGTEEASYTDALSNLAGKRIVLGYMPATEADREIFTQYENLQDLPAYAVKMKPVLRVENEVKLVGSPIGLGEAQSLQISHKIPGIATESNSNELTAGSYYSIVLTGGSVTKTHLEPRAQNLQESADKLNAYSIDPSNDTTISIDENYGELFTSLGLTYFGELSGFNQMAASLGDVSYFNEPSQAMLGSDAKTATTFGVPTSLELGTFFIDVDKDTRVAVARDGDSSKLKAFMSSSGIVASHLEGDVFAQLFGVTETVSAVDIINRAALQGVPIYEIAQNNIDQVISELSVSPAIKEDIRTQVAAGMKVTIPKTSITIGDWHGVGYIIADPDTGSAGYMISGGLGGGALAFFLDLAMLMPGWICAWGSAAVTTSGAVNASILLRISPYLPVADILVRSATALLQIERSSISDMDKEDLIEQVLGVTLVMLIFIAVVTVSMPAAGPLFALLGTLSVDLIYFDMIVPGEIRRRESHT